MWLQLEPELIDKAIAALQQAGGMDHAEELRRRRDMSANNDEISQKYLQAARRNHASDGDLEFDSNAIVSTGDDPGAYVMGWKWITDEEAGVESEDDEAEVPA